MSAQAVSTRSNAAADMVAFCGTRHAARADTAWDGLREGGEGETGREGGRGGRVEGRDGGREGRE